MSFFKNILLLLMCSYVFFVKADTLTLEKCYEQALLHYPLIAQKELVKNNLTLKTANLNTNYYPQINTIVQASYQSDVTSIPQLLPMIPPFSIDKDQYKAYLELSQIIWDGGATQALKDFEKAHYDSEIENIDAELYKIKEKINLFYFSILLAHKQEQLTNTLIQNIKEKLRSVEVGIKNGVLPETNADIIRAELFKVEQQWLEIAYQKEASVKMLQELTHIEISPNMVFIPPVDTDNEQNITISRPELDVFDFQIMKIDISKKITDSKTRPKIMLFGQAGYGKPALNMLSNSFDDYFMAGARFTWSISAIYNKKRDYHIADIQKDIIKSQKETFEKNIRIASYKELSDINKLNALLEKDDAIIALREKITKEASVRLDKGVITATEYISELNAEQQARITKELHIIQLMMSRVSYKYTMGKL